MAKRRPYTTNPTSGAQEWLPTTDTLEASLNISGPSLLGRKTAGEGGHEELTPAAMTEHTNPAAGDYILSFAAGSDVPVIVDIGNLPVPGNVGEVKMMSVSTLPSGWLLCDGSSVSRTIYADLFSAIGTTYGSGDGSTTFNLPDMRDRFTVGASGTKALGSTGGSETATLSSDNLPAHTHGVSIPASTVTLVNDEPNSTKILGGGLTYTSYLNEDDNLRPFNTGSAGSGTAFSILPKYLALRFLICHTTTISGGGGGLSFNGIQRIAFLTC